MIIIFSIALCPQNYGPLFYARAQNLNWKLTKTYDALLEKYDVLVMPTLPHKAPLLPKSDSTPAGQYGIVPIINLC